MVFTRRSVLAAAHSAAGGLLRLKHSAVPLPMLILSPQPANWLWQTLLHQVGKPAPSGGTEPVAS